MNKGDKVGIVCCSNGQRQGEKEKIDRLEQTLLQVGLIPVFSDCIYGRNSVFSGSGKERADCLMDFYRDSSIKAIFDISGGDLANEVLPYLDYDLIGQSRKLFWGYSDLTTVLNAVYAMTGRPSALYQIKNLIYEEARTQIPDFSASVFDNTKALFSFRYRFVRQTAMQGVVVGGNIRCLLKLAGTRYWPDMHSKILLLESLSGTVPQMTTYLNQLQQIGVFDEINGVLLGTFTEFEKKDCCPSITELVQNYTKAALPIAKTDQIGHGADSKAILIGKEITLSPPSSDNRYVLRHIYRPDG